MGGESTRGLRRPLAGDGDGADAARPPGLPAQQELAILHLARFEGVNVRSLVEAGDPYSKENMEGWNEELVRACPRYRNMRVHNWAADVKNAWFKEDGIHFTSPGYAARAELIAQALALAFPAEGKSPDGARCVVS